MPYLNRLPESTFGGAYAAFMRNHTFHPDDRDEVRFIEEEDLAYVMLRHRQIHDFAHVLCGLPPTVLGELALKWYELVQTRLPVAALSAVVGPTSLPPEERTQLTRVYVPWALASARRSTLLLNVKFEDHFETPLDEFRERLQLKPAPSLVR